MRRLIRLRTTAGPRRDLTEIPHRTRPSWFRRATATKRAERFRRVGRRYTRSKSRVRNPVGRVKTDGGLSAITARARLGRRRTRLEAEAVAPSPTAPCQDPAPSFALHAATKTMRLAAAADVWLKRALRHRVLGKSRANLRRVPVRKRFLSIEERRQHRQAKQHFLPISSARSVAAVRMAKFSNLWYSAPLHRGEKFQLTPG